MDIKYDYRPIIEHLATNLNLKRIIVPPFKYNEYIITYIYIIYFRMNLLRFILKYLNQFA